MAGPYQVKVRTPDGWQDLVQAGQGVPPGGGAGQALVKKTGTSFDTEWGVAGAPPEVLVSTTEPVGTEILWVDTDEPGVDLSNWSALNARVAALEPGPWQAVSLASGWTIGTSYGPTLDARRADGLVHMRGYAQSPAYSFPVVMFTLPGDCRPSRDLNRVPIAAHNGGTGVGFICMLTIFTDGRVQATTSGAVGGAGGQAGSYFYFDGVVIPVG